VVNIDYIPYTLKILLSQTKSPSPLPMSDTNPSTLQSLPDDIIYNIIDLADRPTRISWSCTCQKFYAFASLPLWRKLHIKGSQFDKCAEIEASSPDGHPACIVHALVNNAYRADLAAYELRTESIAANKPLDLAQVTWSFASLELSTADISTQKSARFPKMAVSLPNFFVQHLRIDDMEEDQCQEQSAFASMLPKLLACLPSLTSLHHDGHLIPEAFHSTVQYTSLKYLSIRTGNELFKDSNETTQRMGRLSVIPKLDFAVLAKFQNLRGLGIGQFHSEEASGLAKALPALKLVCIKLACRGWIANKEDNDEDQDQVEDGDEDEDDDSVWTFNDINDSPLIVLLEALVVHDEASDQPGGFPSTLKFLTLRDTHSLNIPSLHQLIARSIATCEALEVLRILIVVHEDAHRTLNDLGLPGNNKLICLGSWQQLSSEQDFKVIYNYRNPSGRALCGHPWPHSSHRSVFNIAKTLDTVIADHRGGNHWRLMKFIRNPYHCETDAIFILPYCPLGLSAATHRCLLGEWEAYRIVDWDTGDAFGPVDRDPEWYVQFFAGYFTLNCMTF